MTSFHSTIQYLGIQLLKVITELGGVVHACNPSTGDAEAGGSGVQGQPGLNNEILSQKTKVKMIMGSFIC
jgi:hypothetical protein